MELYRQILLALIGLLGLLALALGATGHTPPPAGPGDWVIPKGDTTVIADQTVNLTGDVIIRGNLTLDNTTLRMSPSSAGEDEIHNYCNFSIINDSLITWNETDLLAYNFQNFDGSNLYVYNSTVAGAGYHHATNMSRRTIKVQGYGDLDNATIEGHYAIDSMELKGDGSRVRFSTVINYYGSTTKVMGLVVNGPNITISDSAFYNYAILPSQATSESNADAGLKLSASATQVRIERSFFGGYANGIFAKDADNIIIDNNTFDTQGTAIYLLDFDHFTISNNTITANETGGFYGGGPYQYGGHYGLWLYDAGALGTVIEYNTVSGFDQGIRLRIKGETNATVQCNYVHNNTDFGFFIEATASYLLLNNNIAEHNGVNIKATRDLSATYCIGNLFFPSDKGYDLTTGNGGMLELLDTYHHAFKQPTTAGSYIIAYWYLDVQVIDEDGAPVGSATVNITNVTGFEGYIGTTNANGWLRDIPIPQYNATSTAVHWFNPYTVYARKAGALGSVAVNITGVQDDVILTIYQTDLTSTVWVNIYNQYTNLGVIDELLKLEYSFDGSNWTRIPEKHMVFDFSGATVHLRLLDFLNQTVAQTTKVLTLGDVYWDAPVPLLTFFLEPQYDVKEWTFTRNGEEVGFFGNEITVLGGLYGDETIIYELSWKAVEIQLEDGTNWTVVAGSVNLTAMGDETRKVGFVSRSIPMKLQSKYVPTPGQDEERTFMETMSYLWSSHEFEITLITTALGFIGLAVAFQRLVLAQKSAEKTELIEKKVNSLERAKRRQAKQQNQPQPPTRSRPGRPGRRTASRPPGSSRAGYRG